MYTHTNTHTHICIYTYIMEGVTSNLIVITFEEKGLGRIECIHKLEEGLAFSFLTFLYLNFQTLHVFYFCFCLLY